eukprot:SAG11_NODE_21345_length_427_cov_0.740854_1_plen_26_part_01
MGMAANILLKKKLIKFYIKTTSMVKW